MDSGKSKTINTVLIGVGRIGFSFENDVLRKKPASHLGALRHLGEFINTTAICDIDQNKLTAATNWFAVNNEFLTEPFLKTNSYREAINTHPDLIVIATPPETHFDIIKYTCSLAVINRPAVIFCEKPLGMDGEEAFKASELCKSKNITLAVNYTRRFTNFWNRVRAYDVGKLGPVKLFSGVYSGDPRNVGVHMADLACWWDAEDICIKQVNTDRVVFEVQLWFEKHLIMVRSNGLEACFYDSGRSTRFQGVYEYSHKPISFITPHTDENQPLLNAYLNIINNIKFGDKLGCLGDDAVNAETVIDVLVKRLEDKPVTKNHIKNRGLID